MDIDHRLIDDFQAAAVILALAAVFFGIQYQAIIDVGELRIPTGGIEARKKVARKFLSALLYRIGPLAAASGASSILFFPSVIEIVRRSHLSLTDFDFIRTAWVLTFAFLASAFAWTCFQAIRFLRLICKARRQETPIVSK